MKEVKITIYYSLDLQQVPTLHTFLKTNEHELWRLCLYKSYERFKVKEIKELSHPIKIMLSTLKIGTLAEIQHFM